MATTERIAAIVLAGGRAARLGNAEKPYLSVAGRPLLGIAVAAARSVGADPVVVVGPPAPDSLRHDPDLAGVLWTRETPPGGGPARGVAAGLDLLAVGHPAVERVLLLAGDAPRVGRALPSVRAAARSTGAAWAVCDGVTQPLLSAWDPALLAGLPLSEGGSLFRALATLAPVAVEVAPETVADADTWHDLITLRQEESMSGTRLQQWAETAAAEAGVPAEAVDVDAILDLARESAHNVERPAAPVTTYLLGYAAGRGLDAAATAALADRLAALARRQAPAAE